MNCDRCNRDVNDLVLVKSLGMYGVKLSMEICFACIVRLGIADLEERRKGKGEGEGEEEEEESASSSSAEALAEEEATTQE